MARQRRNPSALIDPKLSVVIPVYNEKATIDEILRRVQETDGRKEIVVVDDCSTDGTRQILQDWAKRRAAGEAAVAAQDGGDPVELRDVRILFSGQKIRAKARLCGAVSRKPPATSCWCRTLTSNMTHATIRNCWNRFWTGGGRSVWVAVFGRAQRVHYFWHYVANKC